MNSDTLYIPHYLRHLPLVNGEPLPFIATTHPDRSEIVQRVPEKIIEAMHDKLCGLCGRRLEYWVWFMGNNTEIMSRTFVDPPTHRVCAEYLYRKRRLRFLTAGVEETPLFLGRTRSYKLKKGAAGDVVYSAPFSEVIALSETGPNVPDNAPQMGD